MKKSVYLLCVLSCFNFFGCSVFSVTETTLSGVVRDKDTGLPVASAVVSDGKYGNCNFSVTDEGGHYSYRTFCEEHTLEITADGYPRTVAILKTPFVPSAKPLTLNIELSKE